MTGEEVAIKKIVNVFANPRDTKRTLREIKLLRHFKHENVRCYTPFADFTDTQPCGYLASWPIQDFLFGRVHDNRSGGNGLAPSHCQRPRTVQQACAIFFVSNFKGSEAFALRQRTSQRFSMKHLPAFLMFVRNPPISWSTGIAL